MGEEINAVGGFPIITHFEPMESSSHSRNTLRYTAVQVQWLLFILRI